MVDLSGWKLRIAHFPVDRTLLESVADLFPVKAIIAVSFALRAGQGESYADFLPCISRNEMIPA
jgi:hypothetical protein